jgi:hypothetical protein
MDIPYSRAICPEQVTSIAIESSWRAKVTVRQTLVFLDAPEPGDLRDTLPMAAAAAHGGFIDGSPDAREIARRQRGKGPVVLHWEPIEPVTPYALYSHQCTWTPSSSYELTALCTECRCDKPTGILGLEIVTPGTVETVVAFKTPRWQSLRSERSVVKYALRQLEAGVTGEQTTIADNRQRVELKVLGPQVGDRYICVVFHQYGVAHWQEKLKSTSISGRLRTLMGRLVPT